MNRNSSLPTSKERYPELDLMRFFAASAVVIYHFTSRDVSNVTGSQQVFNSIKLVTKFGYLGVELFFMISGFVILASALNRSSIDFAISRATRLYPTYWAAMLLTTGAVYLLGDPAVQVSLLQFLANITMLNDYLGISNIDDVYWTLHAEIKFYFCIFTLILLNLIRHYKTWLSIWLTITATFLLFKQPFFMGWFITPYYSSYFIGGAILYLIRREGMSILYGCLLIVSCLLSIIYAYKNAEGFIPNITERERYFSAGFVCAFYLLFFMFSAKKITIKSNPLILIIGGLTYPLYLIHAKIGQLFFDRFAQNTNPYLIVAINFFLAYFGAYLLHTYVEKRISNEFKILLDKLFKRPATPKTSQQ